MGAANVVIIGGGDGGSVVTKAHVRSNIINQKTTVIIGSTDDGYSTGRLREMARVAGYYGDLTKVESALHEELWGGRQADVFMTRFQDGIPEGPFGNLTGNLFGPAFGDSMKGPYREQSIRTIWKMLHVDPDNVEDFRIRELLKGLFDYCLSGDSYPRHSYKNYLLFTLEQLAKQRGWKPDVALEALHVIYRIPKEFRVVPVTWESGILKAKTRSGQPIEGQFRIDFRHQDPSFRRFDEIKELWIDPPVSLSEEAERAISVADAFVLCCGSIRGNIIAPFTIPGMKEALRRRIYQRQPLYTPVVYVMNLMTESDAQFDRPYTAADVSELIQSAIGERLTCIIFDSTPIPKDIRRRLLPERKIQLGDLTSYQSRSYVRFRHPDLERPFLLKREVSRIIEDVDPSQPPKYVHDPAKLSLALAEALAEVTAGALV
jgi:2-phospho-L-lactate transferase/gluconeogenesis factor (CofD/UPF0052 family)